MLDYLFLKVAWWAIIGGVLIIYACTAGYDAGVTMYMPFLRKEIDRRVVLNTSAPTWDGNLSWIVFAGGGLFVVWPVVYSTAFSGMYAAMLIILFTLFLRPPGYEYRNKVNNPVWRRAWDWGLFISGAVPVFVFGVALGNCFIGFPFHYDPNTIRGFYTGNFWGLLNPYAVLSGVIAVLMVLMHGSVYLQRRTEGHLRRLGFKVHVITAILLLIGFTVSGFLLIYNIVGYKLIASAAVPTLKPLDNIVTTGAGYWIETYEKYPWKYPAPFIAYAGIIGSIWAAARGKRHTAFWVSCFGVGGIIATAGATLFPFLMPSSTFPAQSLTVWNSVSTQYALNVMFYVGVVLLLFILVYKIIVFKTIWGKTPIITAQDIEKDDHAFY